MSSPNEKSLVRRTIRQKLAALSPEARAAHSARLYERLNSLTIWREARTILAFAALQDEPDLDGLLAEAISAGRRIALPQFVGGETGYQAVLVTDWKEGLIAARFGVREPKSGSPVVPWKQLDLVLVPGLAFDRRGARLGRGRGFYDRLLVDCAGHRCGVAFDAQIVEAVPEEAHDRRMNSILTPTLWFETGVGGDD